MYETFEPQRCGFFRARNGGCVTRGSAAAVRVSANLHACRFYRLDVAPPPLRNTGDLLRKAADLNQSRFPLMRNPPDLVHGRHFLTRKRCVRYPESRRPAQ
jgi:hypothetical protein